jgi:hypothetical protein
MQEFLMYLHLGTVLPFGLDVFYTNYFLPR